MNLKALLNKLAGFKTRQVLSAWPEMNWTVSEMCSEPQSTNTKRTLNAPSKKAKAFNAEAQELRQKELQARQAEVGLLMIAEEAEKMALQIEKTIGFNNVENIA